MTAAKRRRYDDDESFDASVKKKGSHRTALLVGSIIGVVVLATTCACACGLGIAMFVFYPAKQPEGSQPEEFIGSWKGRFFLHGQQRDVVYTFEPSGRWTEVDFTPAGRRLGSTSDRWAFQNGQITINFDGGTSESATPVFNERNTMDYRIVRHDDRTQIGARTTFRRQ